MRVARVSRGYDPRWIWQAPRRSPRSAAALFIRSFERGERVLPGDALAGLRRNACPSATAATTPACRRAWTASMLLPALAAVARPRIAGLVRRDRHCGGRSSTRVHVRIPRRDARRCDDVDRSPWRRASGSPSSDRTAPARPPSSSTSTASSVARHGIRARSAGCPSPRHNLGEVRRRVGIVFQDPDDQLFMPTVRQDVAFGPAEPRPARRRARCGASALRSTPSAWRTCGRSPAAPPQLRSATTGRRGDGAGDGPDRSSSSTSRPSNLDPASRRAGRRRATARAGTTLIVTHDLPYALEMCPRSLILHRGAVTADGPTRALLSDEALMAANRLELRYRFELPHIGSSLHTR